jgi:lysozyme
MVLFGLDASHHQGTLDFARMRQESGIEFVFLKATEGSTFVDSEFAANLRRAQAAGQLTAAYHYQRSNASAADQVANIRRVVPTGVPVILDVEANSGNVALTFDIVARLRAVGYRVPLTYIPRWYWQQTGSPSLVGLPPLWSSRYPDNVAGSVLEEYADVPASYWTGYGGLPVAVLQFTSSGRLPGYSGNLDLNAYQGTRAGLSALLFGTPVPTTTTEEDDDVKTFYVHGDGTGVMGATAPKGYENTKWGDAVFHVDSTADGMRRRHVSEHEWACVEANGAKAVQRPQAWVDTIPWGSQPGLFYWEQPAQPAT